MGKLFPVCGNSKNAADGSGYPHIVGLKPRSGPLFRESGPFLMEI